MRAVVADRPGDAGVLVPRDVPAPAIRPNDVRIAVAHCGVCFHDVVVRKGTFRRDVAMPVILGHEVAGIVEAVGEAVRGFAPGDRVAATHHRHICGHCRYCRDGRESTCAELEFLGDAGLNGGYAELVSICADTVVPLPDGIPFAEASITACAIGTGLNAVREIGRVRPGDRVLVTGAGGGLGIHAVQLARLAGGLVVAVTTSAAKAGRIAATGADEVLVVGRGEDFSARVKALTAGEGVDVVIDNVGSPSFHPTRRSLAPGGRWVLVGQLTGDFVSVNLAQLFLRDLKLLSAKGVSRAQLADSLALVAAGRLRPIVDTVLPLAEAARAHELVESGAPCGRVVLEVAGALPEPRR